MRLFCLIFFTTIVFPAGSQQGPKIVEQSGHLAPVLIKVTFKNGQSRNVMLRGFGNLASDSFLTHQFVVRADGGASIRRFWTDAMGAIKGSAEMRTRNSDFVVVLKNGSQVSAQFTGMNCTGEIRQDSPQWDCRTMYTYNEDDGDQKIDLMQVSMVEFLAVPKRDKAGYAMFETWKYSPYTGEKLQ